MTAWHFNLLRTSNWTIAKTWGGISANWDQVTHFKYNVIFYCFSFSCCKTTNSYRTDVLVMNIAYDYFLTNERKNKACCFLMRLSTMTSCFLYQSDYIALPDHHAIPIKEMNCFLHQMNFRSRSAAHISTVERLKYS